MLKTSIQLLLALSLSTSSALTYSESNPELTLYNQAALYGASEKKSLDAGRFYLKMPSTLIEDSLIVQMNDEVEIIKKEYKSNNFKKLIKANIGQKIKIGDKTGVLEGIEGGYLLFKNNDERFHVAINSIDRFSFEKRIPLDNNVYEVFTDSDSEKERVGYNYLFRGIKWHTNHQIFMDKENNIDYRSDLVIDNNTDIGFDGVRLNLMAGDINLSTHQVRRQSVRMSADSLEMSSGGAKNASFNSFEGFQRLRLPKPISLEKEAKTDLSFQNFKDIPNRKEYRFGSLRPSTRKVEDKKANMFLILEREDNEQYHFPFTQGKVSVYKGEEPKNQTLLTRQSISNHSKDDDIEIGLGESFDVDVDYHSQKVNEKRRIVSTSKDRTHYRITKDYEFDITLKNNEPSEVVAIYNFSGSSSHKKPIKVTIPANSEVKKEHKVRYKSNRYH